MFHARALVAGVVAFVSLAMGLGIGSTPTVEAQTERGSSGPNVIVVMVDDQGLKTFSKKLMPKTFALRKGGRGTELRGYASPPLCCPARAGFLTGQYPHNHGVLQNDWRFLNEPDNTLPAWLQNAGYRTGFVGKYLNEYQNSPNPAGGWESWFELMSPTGYFKYFFSDQGIVGQAGERRDDYSTRVVTEESRDFIRESAGDPFFLWSAYFAPHPRNSNDSNCGRDAPTPLPEDWREFKDAPVKLSKSYNEADVSDKSSRLRNRAPLTRADQEKIEKRVRCTYAAMQEVDQGVRKIRKTVEKAGIEDDTVIIYLSDNGAYFGEHRIVKGKYLPYIEAVRVPMIVHVPPKFLGGGEVARVKEPVANIDLAPTILDLAGAESCTAGGDCRTMDGRSIVPLLRGEDAGWPDPRPIGLQLKKQCIGYKGVYRGKQAYFEWYEREGDGEECRTKDKELYDLGKDPAQLENRLHGDPSGGAEREAKRLAKLTNRLTICAGIEGRDQRVDGRPFCPS